MVGTTSNWEDELGGWLKPFLARLGHKARRRMCPLYVAGLIGPGDRKSVAPMAERLAPGGYDQLHHFVAAGVWDAAPLETELIIQADRPVGGNDAVVRAKSLSAAIAPDVKRFSQQIKRTRFSAHTAANPPVLPSPKR
jgi:hypothetical protein